MNRISLIGIIFGLILLIFMSFLSGFITSYVLMPQGTGIESAHPMMQQGSAPSSATAPNKASPASDLVAASQNANEAPEQKATAEMKAAQAIEEQGQKSAAARTPVEGDAGKFSVQLKTVRDKLWAVQTMATLRRLGYGTYAVPTQLRGGGIINRTIYDLRVGVFNDYVTANDFARKLRAMGHRTATVTMITNKLKIVKNLND